MTVADDRRFIMTDGASETKRYHRCPNNWFGVHDYQPRYDVEPSNAAGFTSVRHLQSSQMEALFTKKTYVRDICVRCGKTVERAEK